MSESRGRFSIKTTFVQAREGSDGDLVMFLVPNQLVADTFRPVPRASLSRRTRGALLVLRVFVLLVTTMVIYAFATHLH